MSREAVCYLYAIITQISKIPVGAQNALRNYLFLGNPNPDKTLGDDYVQYIMD